MKAGGAKRSERGEWFLEAKIPASLRPGLEKSKSGKCEEGEKKAHAEPSAVKGRGIFRRIGLSQRATKVPRCAELANPPPFGDKDIYIEQKRRGRRERE
jgi:hypothetical protein